MDIFLLIVAGICMIVGIIGCIVPGLPGVPVSYAGLWIAQATERVDFSWQIFKRTCFFKMFLMKM